MYVHPHWLSIYFLTIEFETQTSNTNILIYTSMGELVYSEENILTNNLSISTRDFSNGLYSIVISHGNDLITSYKFIKE